MPSDLCFRCGHSRDDWTRKCGNCHTEFWCQWDPDSYKGRLTRISLGQDPAFRRFAAVAVTLGAVALIYGLVLQVYYAAENSRDVAPLFALFIGGFALYEVWAFFHGRATMVDYVIHEPRPENTWWRSAGLLGNVVFFAIAWAMLYRIK